MYANPFQNMKTRSQPYEDRHEAALCLAEALFDLAQPPWPAGKAAPTGGGAARTVLLGLTRGGIPIADTLARQLHLPFDCIVVRKLPVPGNPELAMGAISEYGAEVVNEGILRWIPDCDETFSSARAREEIELKRRICLYRGNRGGFPLRGNHVVLVDDGAATGATMRAAIAAARNAGAGRVTVALPVAPRETCEELAATADEVRCVWQPESFQSVGACYRHFPQVDDHRVLEALSFRPEFSGGLSRRAPSLAQHQPFFP
jgi:putative phosphoribosyl transferase